MRFIARLICLVILAGLALGCLAKEPLILKTYRKRVKPLGKQVPAITQCAEAVVAREIAHPELHIRYPWPNQLAFGDEFIARSGGLANWDYDAGDAVPVNPNDVMLYCVRSWEEDGADAKTLLAKYRQSGWLVILFASKAGMPKDLPPYDYFIDNGAKSGSKSETRVNLLVNMTNGWLWHTEYIAAFTRKGLHPGVLMSIMLPGAEAFDNDLSAHKEQLYPCDTPIPAGKLAKTYLKRIDWLVKDLATDRVQGQIAHAAEVIVQRIREGGPIKLSTTDHAVEFEIRHEVKSPFIPFSGGEDSFKQNTKPSELLVWFGYIGMSTYDEDFATWIRNAGVQLVTSYVTDPNTTNNAQGALAHIEQSWKIGDAEVPLPFKPDKMAPMSAVNQLLLFRMLDDAVAERLAK